MKQHLIICAVTFSLSVVIGTTLAIGVGPYLQDRALRFCAALIAMCAIVALASFYAAVSPLIDNFINKTKEKNNDEK